MFRPTSLPTTLAVATLALAGCTAEGAESSAPPAERLRLFDQVSAASFTDLPAADGQPATTETLSFDFDGHQPERIWWAIPEERGLGFGEDVGEVDPAGGLDGGGGLRLGPEVPEDLSCAVLIVPVPGLARVVVRGRVRLEDNPSSGESSTREVLRVLEHTSVLRSPRGAVPRWRASRPRRVSRRLDPSGWDHFEVSFITKSSTESIEVQLLHRSGGSAQAVTRFDDVAVDAQRLAEAEIYAHLAERYRGVEADAEPWRLRVNLEAAGGRRDEVRDAVLLPPPASLAIPLRLPASIRPVLRFQYGMVAESHAAAGDGVRLAVSFRGADGNVALGELEIDAKNDRSHRSWQRARIDLGALAGQRGELVFTASDIPGTDPDASGAEDPLDALVLATPRIEPSEPVAGAPNVLLIGVDTLRADRMSAFGYERNTTPHLTELADKGVRFMKTRSQAPWTLPSFSSILTSLYPSTHGAGRGGHDEWTGIDPSTTSLAEILARVGYETQGIVANGLISPQYGLDQGFEGYQSAWSMESVANDTEDVVAFIDEHRTTPWLLFWHIMDPHLPYSTEDQYRVAFTEEGYDGRFARGFGGASVPFGVLDPRPGRRWYAHEGPPPAPDLEDRDRRFVHDYYDAEIAETDAAVGRVLEALRYSNQWGRTIVAFVADHGEGLGDHDHYHHGYTLFDDQVHIPMLLRIPGQHEGVVIERPVASIDLVPTILGGLGLDQPAFLRGVDRLAPDAPVDDAYFIEYPTYDSSAQKAWVQGEFKYLHDPLFRTEALYHLGRDPAEKTNVLAEFPSVVARARAELDTFRWNELQKGRFHLRIRGKSEQRLAVVVHTDDLFDANFATRPQRPETEFSMDLARRRFGLQTVLEEEDLELVFWCRGTDLRFEVTLDDRPVLLEFGGRGSAQPTPLDLVRGDIATRSGADIAWPRVGNAVLWLERGVSQAMPVVLSPEEIERLKELGYTK